MDHARFSFLNGVAQPNPVALVLPLAVPVAYFGAPAVQSLAVMAAHDLYRIAYENAVAATTPARTSLLDQARKVCLN